MNSMDSEKKLSTETAIHSLLNNILSALDRM